MVLQEWWFEFSLGFKEIFLDVPNLWFAGLKKIIWNLGLKGVMEKYVGCFLVYSFLGVLKLAFFL